MIELTKRDGRVITVNHKHISYLYTECGDEGESLYTVVMIYSNGVKVREKIEEILMKISEAKQKEWGEINGDSSTGDR